MSEPSFRLSKRGSEWVAALSGFKRPIEVSCGDGSKAAAEKFAQAALKRRCQQAAAGRQRAETVRAAKARAARAASSAPKAKPAAPSEDTPAERPAREPDPPEPEPEPEPVPEEETPPSPSAARAEEIRAKLAALGDSRPIEPDSVAGPDDQVEPDPDPEMDEEAGALLADVLASAVVVGHCKLVARRLGARKPPERPGEPNERMLGWYQEGIAYNARKLLGKATAMGPTAKMFVGAGLMTLGMFIDAELIPGAAAEPAAPAAPPPAARAPAPPHRGGTVTELMPLGRFK